MLAQLLFDINGSVIEIKRVDYKEMTFKLFLVLLKNPLPQRSNEVPL